eukprot:TCALIF_11654-PA protein Name:"Similar to Perlucin (Haliotis laevigata)" AED:0.53 eAED:0.53 QI:0/0.25/0/0.4/0.75/0.8/5/0/476
MIGMGVLRKQRPHYDLEEEDDANNNNNNNNHINIHEDDDDQKRPEPVETSSGQRRITQSRRSHPSNTWRRTVILVNLVVALNIQGSFVDCGQVIGNGRNGSHRRGNSISDGSSSSNSDSGVYRINTDLTAPPFENESSLCPIAFHEIGGKCYFYGYFKLNWFRAMEFCHSFGQSVSLACIENTEENDSLKQWLEKHGDHTTGVWVGGSDNGHPGKWAWFPTGQLIRQFNWGPSQPSGDDQHCMYIVGGFMGYQWADFHCSFEMTFLCEYEVNPQMAWRKRRMNDDKAFGKNHQPRTNDSQASDYLSELSEHIKEFQKQAQEEQEFSTFPNLRASDLVTTVKAVDTTETEKFPVYITPLSRLANLLVTSRTPLDRLRTKVTPPVPVMVSSGPIIHHENSVVISPPNALTNHHLPSHTTITTTTTTWRPKLPTLSNNVFSFKDKTRYPAVQQNGPLDLQDKQKAWKIYDLIKQKILSG